MLPAVKIGWGTAVGVAGVVFLFSSWTLGLLLLVIAGAFLAVGLSQRNQSKWQIRALIHKAHRHPQNAEDLLAEALRLDQENAEALAASADHSYSGGNWAAAADLYERYLAKAPDDWQAEAHLGCSSLNAGNPDFAIPHLQAVRALTGLTEDSHISLTNALSLAFLEKSDPSQALEIIKTLPLQRHALGAILQQSLFLRAVAHYELHQARDAVTDLDRLYALNPSYPGLQEAKEKMKSGTYTLGAARASLDLV
jgi:tetratricopeptide (TPR) repeat protein